jgi:polygalacturonase
MKDNEIACTAHADGLPRREFLRNSLLMAVPVVLMGSGLPMPATAAVYDPPTRKRGSTVRSVRNYGAVGNGVHDDTAAFQAAINSLPSTGGTVTVPAGTYLIDAVRSVKLRSLMHLRMDPNAKLVAKPTSASSYNVLFADVAHDVEISGGQIIGERDKHKGTGGGEGGHGIRIRGSERVTIRDIRVSKGWGDGITVGPRPNYGKRFTYSKDVVIANIVCTGNRRNGLSIGNVIGMKVYDSEFSDTNGTTPQCGIDVEPSPDVDGSGYCSDVRIENCRMNGNAAYGINVWKNTRNLAINKCTIEGNRTCGMVTRGMKSSSITGNTIRKNMSTGLFIQIGTSDVGISGNVFYDNYLKQGNVDRALFTLSGVTSKLKKDLIVGDGTSAIRVGMNTYK